MTGVSAATLRAWERRYGIPIPQRSEAAYRIYTEDDVLLIGRLKTLIDDGMAPAEAAQLVLSEIHRLPEPAANTCDPFALTRNAMADAVARFDPEALEAAMQQTMTLASASAIFDHVVAPVMLDVGDRWHAGQITVAQEHLASVVVENTLRKLLDLVQPSENQRRVVLACLAEETHTLPLFGVAVHLASAGFRVTPLGARTPPDAVQHAVEQLLPVCVGLSATIAPSRRVAPSMLEGYARACPNTPWILGGRAAKELQPLVESNGGTVALGDDTREFVRVIEALGRTRPV